MCIVYTLCSFAFIQHNDTIFKIIHCLPIIRIYWCNKYVNILRHHHITYASFSLPLKAQVNNKLELPKLKSDKQLCKLLFKSNLNIFVAVVGNVIVVVVVNYCTVPNFRACNYCCVVCVCVCSFIDVLWSAYKYIINLFLFAINRFKSYSWHCCCCCCCLWVKKIWNNKEWNCMSYMLHVNILNVDTNTTMLAIMNNSQLPKILHCTSSMYNFLFIFCNFWMICFM